MWQYNYSNGYELYHYGRKGMKWGQNIFGKVKAARTAKRRKAALVKAREAKAAKKIEAEKRAKDIERGKISVKKMTDAEIKARMERLQLEKNYTDLVNQVNSNRNVRGKRFLNKFLDSTVDKVAENSAADVVAQAIKVIAVKGVNKAFGSEEVFTNNKKK